jgi:hypothetical protein
MMSASSVTCGILHDVVFEVNSMTEFWSVLDVNWLEEVGFSMIRTIGSFRVGSELTVSRDLGGLDDGPRTRMMVDFCPAR